MADVSTKNQHFFNLLTRFAVGHKLAVPEDDVTSVHKNVCKHTKKLEAAENHETDSYEKLAYEKLG
jgi:hypothetical protein